MFWCVRDQRDQLQRPVGGSVGGLSAIKRLGWSLLSCVCPSLLWGRNKSFGTVDQSDFRFKPGSEEMSIKGIGKHPERAVREGELKHVTAEYCIYFWACRSTRGNRQPRLSGERRMMTMTSPPERCVWCRQSEQYVMLAPQWQVHAVSAAADSSWLLELARRPHCVNVQRWHNSRLVVLTREINSVVYSCCRYRWIRPLIYVSRSQARPPLWRRSGAEHTYGGGEMFGGFLSQLAVIYSNRWTYFVCMWKFFKTQSTCRKLIPAFGGKK